jgi:hypothetical protein
LHRQQITAGRASPSIASLALDFVLFVSVVVTLPFLAIARAVKRR